MFSVVSRPSSGLQRAEYATYKDFFGTQ